MASKNPAVGSSALSRALWWKWLGKNQNYVATLNQMKECAELRRQHSGKDTLLLVELSPVYTYKPERTIQHFKVPHTELRERWKADVVETNRGGDVTFHGPGQLVVYPILDLREHKKDLKWYVRQLEEVMIKMLDKWELKGEREPGLSGVWVRGKKIGAIGVHVSHWITSHGFAFNVSTDMDYFSTINPCGITDRGVTSLQKELQGREVAMNEVREEVLKSFATVFDREVLPLI